MRESERAKKKTLIGENAYRQISPTPPNPFSPLGHTRVCFKRNFVCSRLLQPEILRGGGGKKRLYVNVIVRFQKKRICLFLGAVPCPVLSIRIWCWDRKDRILIENKLNDKLSSKSFESKCYLSLFLSKPINRLIFAKFETINTTYLERR